MRDQILKLKEQGLSYNEIQRELGCSKSTINYHLLNDDERKALNKKKTKNVCPILKKIGKFKEDKSKNPSQLAKGKDNSKNKIKGGINKIINVKRNQFSIIGSKAERVASGDKRVYMFTNQELKQKILDNPFCYLTGDEFDPMDSQAWSLDHILPKSRGGTNELTNAGQTTKLANQMKSDMTVDELLEMCRKVLVNHGHVVLSKEEILYGEIKRAT